MTAGEENYADVWRLEREREAERHRRLERASHRIGVVFVSPLVVAGLLLSLLPGTRSGSAPGGAALLWELPVYAGVGALVFGYALYVVGSLAGMAVEAVLSWRNESPPRFSEITDLVGSALSVGGLIGGAVSAVVVLLAST